MDVVAKILPYSIWPIIWISIYQLSKSILKDAWVLGKDEDKSLLSKWLQQDTAKKIYQNAVGFVLDTTDDLLERRAALVRGQVYKQRSRGVRGNSTFGRNSWSWGLLDFTLFLALAYPPLSILLQWAIFGDDAKLGSLVVFPAFDEVFTRIVLTLALFAAFITGLVTRMQLADEARCTWGRKILSAVSWGLVFTIGFYIAGSGVLAVTGVGVAAALCALLFQGTGAVPGAGTTFALGSAAIGLACSGFLQLPGKGEFSVILGSIAAVILGVGLDWFRIRMELKVQRPTFVLLTFLILFYLVLLAAAVNQQPVGDVIAEEIMSTILFFGMLPIANALADWMSIGFTRFLLSRGTHSNPFFWAILDVVLAAICFFFLGCLMILTIHLVESISGRVLINIPRVLGNGPDSILQDYSNYIWVYFTFLSTLLPTLFHALIGTVTLLLLLNKRIREMVFEKFQSESMIVRNAAGEVFCVFIALIATLTFFLLYKGSYSLLFEFPEIGAWIVDRFRDFAALIGAI